MTAGVPLQPRGRIVRGGFVREFFFTRRGGSIDDFVTATALEAFIEAVEGYAGRLADATLEEAQASPSRDGRGRRLVETEHVKAASRRPGGTP